MLPIIFRQSKSADRTLKTMPHLALSAMRSGKGTFDDWETLATRINIGVVLAARHFKDASEAMQGAVEAIQSAHKRFTEAKRWGLSGDEFRAIGEALNLADEMQEQCTRRELRDAMLFVQSQM